MTYLAAMADLSRVATGGLVTAVWQGVLLAAAVGLGLRLLPKTPAAVRFAIWFGVFVVVAALPLAALWSHAAGSTGVGGRGAWLTLDARWSFVIAAVWMLTSLVRVGTLVIAASRVRTLWGRAKPVEFWGAGGSDPAHCDKAAMDGAPGVARVQSAGGLHPTHGDKAAVNGAPGDSYPTHGDKAAVNGAPGVWSGARRALLCTSDEVDRPTVIGFFSPKILIPTWLLEQLTPAELDQIVLHETGHLGRADDWMNLLQKIALVVFPLNPALAWVERRLCFERELACDERVLRTTHAPKAYAACLAMLAEYRIGRRRLSLALGALGRESELGRRVGRILRSRETMRPVHAKLVLGGAMLGLLSGAVALERCPQVIGFAGVSVQRAAVAAQRSVSVGSMYHAVSFRGGNEVARSMMSSGVEQSVASVVGADETGPQRLKPRVEGDVYGTAEAVPLSRTGYDRVEAVRLSRTGIDPEGIHGGKTGYGAANGMRLSKMEMGHGRSLQLINGTSSLGRRHLDHGVSSAREIADAGRSEKSSLIAASQRRTDAAVEWVVVTAWQGEDGSHMVLTMATNSNARVEAVRQRVINDTEPTADQVYPYAVPVRGGWLVFQL